MGSVSEQDSKAETMEEKRARFEKLAMPAVNALSVSYTHLTLPTIGG